MMPLRRNRKIAASRALYIKLGEGNRWAQLSFDTGTLRFGFGGFSHEKALKAAAENNFRSAKEYYENMRSVNPGTATRYSNEIKNFYTAGRDVLWITFAKGRMWWCFADTKVVPIREGDVEIIGSRYRKALGGWSDKDTGGQTLWTNALRGSLTTTAGFRGTICRVREFDYLLRRLNNQETRATKAVRDARLKLKESLRPLIAALHWKDFELLAELIMTQGGWRRVSATGGTQHTVDFELELPLTGERALVQVKSNVTQDNAEKAVAKLVDAAGDAYVFLIHHNETREWPAPGLVDTRLS